MYVLNLTNREKPFYRQQVAGLEALGVRTEEVSVPLRHELNSLGRAIDYLRFFPMVARAAEDRFDLLHANYGLTAPMALTQRRLPVVLSLWGTDLYGPLGTLTRTLAPYCDEVIVMSDQMKEDIGIPVTVIPHGVDFERFVPIDRAEAREVVGWNLETKYVLFPYRTHRPEKDYPRARRVVDAVSAKLSEPVELAVVTEVAQDEFVHYLNAADALLLTSRYEGSPNAVKEALACNLPVVSTDVGDIQERVHGVSYSCVAEDDDELVESLVRVLEAGERSDGRAAIRDLSLEQTSKRLLEVYERAIAD